MSCFHVVQDAAASAVHDPQSWQSAFEALLPSVRAQVRFAIRHLFGDAQEEAQQEIVATACLMFARLHRQGRAEDAAASSLVRFAVRRYRIGRRMAERTNVSDAMSPACRARRGVRVKSFVHETSVDPVWEEMLVEDRRVSPADLAASRLDFRAFMATLDRRRQQIAEMLGKGETTQDAARQLGLSPGRISQLRREFKIAWDQFVGNVTIEHAAA